MSQEALRLSPEELYSFENFYFGQQLEVKQRLTLLSQADKATYLYLCAPIGEGKSHLLMAAMQATQKVGKQAVYLPLDVLVATTDPAMLDAIEQVDLVCLDSLEAIAGKQAWEEAVFHCFNRLQQSGAHLLVAASVIPSALGLALADLSSRLDSVTRYTLTRLTDADKQQALQLQAAYRGLDLPDEVSRFLLRHYGRDMASLMTVLQRLDHASLTEQRRLTIPFVRQTLNV